MGEKETKTKKLGLAIFLLFSTFFVVNLFMIGAPLLFPATDAEGPPAMEVPGPPGDLPEYPSMKGIANEPNCTRVGYPFIQRMEERPGLFALLGGLNETNIRVAYYNASNHWVEVPFQIDEKGWPYCWDDGDGDSTTYDPMQVAKNMFVSQTSNPNYELHPTAGNPDPNGVTQIPYQIDEDDEIVFYVANGRKVSPFNWWDTRFPSRIMVNITDPVDDGITFMYIYFSASFVEAPVYTSLVNYDSNQMLISTPYYQTRLMNSNPDLVDYARIIAPGTDGQDLVEEMGKSFGHTEFFVDASWAGTCIHLMDFMTQGTWGGSYYDDQACGVDNPMETALQLPQPDPGNTPGWTGWDTQGDGLPIKDGPIRVILMKQTYGHYRMTAAGLIPDVDIYRYGTGTNLYYQNMEQQDASASSFEFPSNAAAAITMDDTCLVIETVRINDTIKDDFTIVAGGNPDNSNPAYPVGGEKFQYINGADTDDDLKNGGDPTTDPPVLPPAGNAALPDWLYVTSTTHGGMWLYMPRVEIVNGISAYKPPAQEYIWYQDQSTYAEIGAGVFSLDLEEGDTIETVPYYIQVVYGNLDNASDLAWTYREYERYQTDLSNPTVSSVNFMVETVPPIIFPYFIQVTPDRLYYKNGDTIHMTIILQDNGPCDVWADFSTIDSTAGDVNATYNGNGQYEVTHIMGASSRSDGPYLIFVTAKSLTSGFTSFEDSTYLELDNTNPTVATLDGLSTPTGSSSIILNWTANPGDDAGAGISHYEVWRGDDANGPPLDGTHDTLIANTTDTYAQDNTLMNGNYYYYMVKTFDKLGQSADSAEEYTQAVFAVDVPAQPDALPAYTGYVVGTTNPDVVIDWSANPGSDGDGLHALPYEVRRDTSPSGSFTTAIQNWTAATSTTDTTTSSADEGTTFYYRVRTRDSLSNIASSGLVSTTVDVSLQDKAIPQEPDEQSPPGTDNTYYSETASILLEWTGQYGYDYLSGIGGYNVYREVGQSGTYDYVATRLPSQKTYMDSDVTNGQDYSYIVETFDNAVSPNKLNSTATRWVTLQVTGPGDVEIVYVDTTPTDVTQGQSGINVDVAVRNPGAANVTLYDLDLDFTHGVTNVTNEYTVTGPAPGLNQTLVAMAAPTVFSFTVAVKGTARGGSVILDAIARAQQAGWSPVEDPEAETTDSWWVNPRMLLQNLTETTDPLPLGNNATITVDATDALTSIVAVLFDNGTSNSTMSGPVGNTYTHGGWSPASPGVYPYRIWANNTEGNWSFLDDSLTVTLLENLTESADPIELGLVETITVDVVTSVDAVLIEFEGANHTMAGPVGNTYTYNSWTINVTGVNAYRIWANDTGGNWSYIDDDISVQDTTNPTYTTVTESADPLELGNTETITINSVNDATGINQVLLEIEGANQTMTDIGGGSWQYDSWTPNSTGNYPYTIYIEDNGWPTSNWNTAAGAIQVQDTNAPTYNSITESADPLELNSTETITILDVIDLSGINQVLLEIEGANQTMADIGGNDWQYNTWTPGSTGNYPYTIYIEDKGWPTSNWNTTAGAIQVQDTTPPVLSAGGANINYEYGDNGTQTINWTFTDLDPDNYTITQVGVGVVDSGTWVSGVPITWNVSGLGLGTHTFRCDVQDGSVNPASDVVTVTVSDTTAPVLSAGGTNVNYELGAAGPILATWTWTDLDADNYTITQVGVGAVDSGIWTSGVAITYNVSGLALGVHTFTCDVDDGSANPGTDNVVVTVTDTTAPVLSAGGSNIGYELGDPSTYTATWTWTDLDADTYTITQVGVGVVDSGTWTSGVAITWDVSSMTTGVHTFTCAVQDGSTNPNSDNVIVTVTDTVPPALTAGGTNINYELGAVGPILATWTWTDFDADNYTITQVGVGTVDSGTWTSGTPITWDVSGLGLGVTTFTCDVDDGSANPNSDNVIVTVTDTTAPALTAGGTDINYELGAAGPILATWIWTDFDPDNYTITEAGVGDVDTGTWTSGVQIQWDVSGKPLGNYTFTCIVQDGSGNLNNDTVNVTVQDTIPPTPPQVGPPVVSADSLTLTWTLSPEPDVDHYNIYRSNRRITNISGLIPIATVGNTTNSYTDSGLPDGKYYYVITAVDALGQESVMSNSIMVIINFRAHLIIIIIIIFGAVAAGGASFTAGFVVLRRRNATKRKLKKKSTITSKSLSEIEKRLDQLLPPNQGIPYMLSGEQDAIDLIERIKNLPISDEEKQEMLMDLPGFFSEDLEYFHALIDGGGAERAPETPMREEMTRESPNSCRICNRKFPEDYEYVLCLKCHTKFHRNCILEWLKRKRSCPACLKGWSGMIYYNF